MKCAWCGRYLAGPAAAPGEIKDPNGSLFWMHDPQCIDEFRHETIKNEDTSLDRTSTHEGS
jgi:hypothetical protein